MRRIAWILYPSLALAGAAGCMSPPARDSAASASEAVARAETMVARGQHEQALALTRAELEDVPPGEPRARLLLAQGRALLALGRPASASLAFARAQREIRWPESELGRTILRATGDAELAAGDPRRAARSYEQALDGAPGGSREADELCLSLAVALEDKDSAAAASWRRRIRQPLASHIRQLEQRLRQLASGSTSPRAPAALARGGGGSAVVPGVHRRAEWGAAAIRGNHDPMGSIWRVTVHHGATPFNATSSAAAAAALRDIQRFHQDDRKWADIGYHFLIDPAGRVWEGRALSYQGAHAGNGDLNRGNVGVCVLGDFRTQPLLPTQKQALATVLSSLVSTYRITPGHIYTHREIRPDPSECPGPALQAFVSSYRGASLAMAPRQ